MLFIKWYSENTEFPLSREAVMGPRESTAVEDSRPDFSQNLGS